MPESYQDVEILDDEKLANPSEYLADIPARLISGVLGLMAFVVACITGLMAGNPGYVILTRAMLAMLVCTIIGRVLGIVGEICICEYVARYKSARPRPPKPSQLVELDREREEHNRVVAHLKNAG